MKIRNQSTKIQNPIEDEDVGLRRMRIMKVTSEFYRPEPDSNLRKTNEKRFLVHVVLKNEEGEPEIIEVSTLDYLPKKFQEALRRSLLC
jgi:hypothetical protein